MDETQETTLRVARRMAEYATEYDANSVQNQAHIHAAIAQAFALIAQAEAAERQAVAMERIDRQLARIATVLNELTSPKLEAPDWDEDGDE